MASAATGPQHGRATLECVETEEGHRGHAVGKSEATVQCCDNMSPNLKESASHTFRCLYQTEVILMAKL